MRSDNHDQTPQGWVDEVHEAFATPLSPTGEALDEGKRFATGGWVTLTGMLYDPESECESILPSNVGHGILFNPDDSKTDRGGVWDGWEPQSLIYNRSVSQTFPMSTHHFRQFMKILGDYRLPGDKPLIHKGKKR